MVGIHPLPPGSSSPSSSSPLRLLDLFLSQFRLASPAVLVVRRRWAIRIAAAIFLLWCIGWLGTNLFAWFDHQKHESVWYRQPANPQSGLVVSAHGWLRGPEDMKEIAAEVAAMPEYSGYGILLWAFDGERLSNKTPGEIADVLRGQMQELHAKAQGDIVLIGHSIGGLIVRRAFANAVEQNLDWVKSVSRIVLLATPNRGSQATSRSMFLWVSDALARAFGRGQLIRSVYRGSPFIVDLQLDWIRRIRALPHPPFVAQLVGDKDDEVSLGDSEDIVRSGFSVEERIPGATHHTIRTKAGFRDHLQRVLRLPRPAPPVPSPPPAKKTVKVMFLHGIRDYADRFRVMADYFRTEAPGHEKFEIKTSVPRYKYFSALEFLDPIARRHKIYEFADLYTELVLQEPLDADIYFIGHSFGTYLMGKSADLYRSINIKRAYFAGSVLNEEFFEGSRASLLGGGIGSLRNDIAAEDWPVGILCRALDFLHLAPDVGTGGFIGFTGADSDRRRVQLRYYKGDHGSALVKDNHSSIAAWLLQDETGVKFDRVAAEKSLRDSNLIVDDRPARWKLWSQFAPGLFLLIFAAALYFLCLCQRPPLVAVEILLVASFLNLI